MTKRLLFLSVFVVFSSFAGVVESKYTLHATEFAQINNTSEEMVAVPAGTSSGVDPDFGSYLLNMTNTVLMDSTEISYSLWCEIYDWAITNGYQFDNPGDRKEIGHPVHSINWFDCAKWSNARSEKNGLTPCYSVMGEIYRVGNYDAVTDYDASGYRMPMWVEFEYAARGDLEGKRFPWGDVITHGEANYFSSNEFDYDLSPTKGGHPDFTYGEDPHSAPCGSFQPNGYGLYDMAGNIWEWCNNSAGAGRHARSGGGNGDARWLRCGASASVQAGGLSDETYHSLGFRTVRNFNVVTTPELSPDGGQHPGSSVQVAVSCETVGAIIRYETGSGILPGTDPDESSSIVPVSGVVSVPVPGWLKTQAEKDGFSPSIVKTAIYREADGEGLAGWRYPKNDLLGHACLEESASIPSGGVMDLQHTIEHVDSVLTGDVDGDGQLEIVVTSGSTMRIHNSSGALERSVDLPRESFMAMLEDVDGDGVPEIFLGGKGSGFASYAYDGNGVLLQTFAGQHGGGSDVTMRPIGLSNGKMLVGYNAGYARTPRGVASFDYGSASEDWYYQIGPANGLYSVADMDADGNLDITMSANTVHNGASGNGTTDGDLYTIVVDENGLGKLTRIYDAPSNGNSSHVFVDFNADGTHDILGFKGHDSTYYPGQAKIQHFAADGTVLNTFNGPDNSRWTGLHSIGDLDGDAVPEIVATAYYSATSTKTYVLDTNLVQLAESSIVGKIELLADVDGDGLREVVLLSRDGMVSLLGQDLSLVSSLQLEGQGFEVIASDLEGDGRIELLCRIGENLHIVGFLAPDGLTVEPNASFVSSGAMGVSFDPASATYALSNTGTTALAWTATCVDSWIDLSSSGGTLNPGASHVLVVGFSGDALVLAEGVHEASIEISVQGASSSQQRMVLLTVDAPTGELVVEDSILPNNDLNMDFGQSLLNEESVEQITIRNSSAQHDLVVEGIGLSWSESSGAQTLSIGSSGAAESESVVLNQAVPPTAIAANAEYRPGVMLVGYIPGKQIAATVKADLHATMGTEAVKTFSYISAEMVKLPPGAKLEEMIEAFAAQPNVAYAEPDYLLKTCDLPDDSRFPELWGMRNTGQTGGTPGGDIGAEEAWNISTGNTNVIVAVIDTGIDYNHPDLAGNMWTNPGEIPGNGLDDDGNGYVDDIHGYDFAYNDSDPMDGAGHGTHCAGTIGAEGDNGIGVAGVNWRVRLMAVKFLSDSGGGYTSDAVEALNYAVASGAHISNNSWGGGGYSSTLKAAIEAAGSVGHLFVAAAGNSGTNNDGSPHYPSSYDCDNIIAVASSDHNDNRSGFSCYGETSVDLSAPGSSILSTIPGEGYAVYNGTSMATPHVAGAAALLKSQRSSASYSELKQWLMNGTDPLPQWNGLVVSGGRLNIAKSLLLGEPPFVLEGLPAWPATLPPGGSVTFDVRKTARREGVHHGLVSIGSNDSITPETYVNLFSDVVYDWMSVMPKQTIEIMHEVRTSPGAVSQTFTLENLGPRSMVWSVSGMPWWLEINPSQGSLASGASGLVTLALDPAVEDLQQGSHETVLEFANETLGTVQQSVIELIITPSTIASFNLHSDPGWMMETGWEFGVPQGGGSFGGDPLSGHTGANVLGYNLNGDYSNNVSEYWLTSSPIDCSGHTNVQLRFWRWLGIESSRYDHASIEVSNDGLIWHSVWTHTGGSFSESSWNEVVYDISAIADDASSVWVRWGMGTTDGSVTYPGWNIDDVTIEGEPLSGYNTPTHYVNVSNSTPVAPFASWATAATNIQDAVDVASSNDTVLVTNGIYYLTSEIGVDKDILLQSINGPDVTIISGFGGDRCMNLGDSQCVVEGFTIRGGYSEVDHHPIPDPISGYGGGVYCVDQSPVLTNCVISGNWVRIEGSGVHGGTLYNCSIVNNVHVDAGALAYSLAINCLIQGNHGYDLGTYAGGAIGSTLTSCIIIGNTADGGGAVTGCVVENSLLFDNYGSYNGGCALWSDFKNCTVIDTQSSVSSSAFRECSFQNSIVWNYHTGFVIGIDSGSCSNTCSPGLSHGVNGNITNAPVFVDESSGDFRLQSVSPCINWGNNEYTNSLIDLDGSNRVVEGYVDMGCYEYHGTLGLMDSDGDGMPDDWEHLYFRGNADPNRDDDGDGRLNWQEQISGMDPRSGISFFAATNFMSMSSGERLIEWPSIEGRYYSVYWKEDLQSDAGWIPVEVNLQSGIFTDTVHGTESHGFYKLEINTEPVSSANKVLMGISIDDYGTEILELDPFAYTCRAYYSDGTSEPVSPAWDTDSTYMHIDASGFHHTEGQEEDHHVIISAEYGGFTVTHEVTVLGRSLVTGVSIQGDPSLHIYPGREEYLNSASYTVSVSGGGNYDIQYWAGGAIWDGQYADFWPNYDDSIMLTATVYDYNRFYDGGEGISGSLTVDLIYSTLYIDGPIQVDENSTAEYRLIAGYSDGYTEEIPAGSWYENESPYADIDSSGNLITLDVLSDEFIIIHASYVGREVDYGVTIKNIEGVPVQPPGTLEIDANTLNVEDPDYGNYSITVDSFYMDETLVTSSLWYQVYNWAATNGYEISTNGVAVVGDHPITQVNWFDCAKWCNARSEMLGRTPCYTNATGIYRTGEYEAGVVEDANGFRIPTWDEWEYAARAGHSSYSYPWGNSITSANANYNNNIGTTTGVTAYPPNDFGIYDMGGNVWEWCNDQVQPNERGTAGGGFSANPDHVKCGFPRSAPADQPTGQRWHIGFRTVCQP
ncbi:S8 family serine peptidase [Pontiellaceae bacterium B12227]|nr:S8 family serine peptidase [Pontiellaceae bacterium B12227]